MSIDMENFPEPQSKIPKELEALFNLAKTQDPTLTEEKFLETRDVALAAHSAAPKAFEDVGGVMMEGSKDNDELKELHENKIN